MEFFPFLFFLSILFSSVVVVFLHGFPDKFLYIKFRFPVPWRSQIQQQIDWNHSQPGVMEQVALTYVICVSSKK